LNFKGLVPTVRDGAEPAELPKEQIHVAGENVIISGMAGRYATALFELAREQNAIDRVKVDLDRFDALVAEVADLARLLRSPVFSADEQTRALSGVLGYSIAKAGIDMLTRWLAAELARRYGDRVRVNAVAPGFFVTEQNRSVLVNPDGAYTDRARAIIAHTPMGRLGTPDEIVGAVQWLCSDAASFVTGVVLPVDGGFSVSSGV